MYRVKFFVQNLIDKSRQETNEVFFDDIDDSVLILIKTQRFKLQSALTNSRIICLIENVEDV